MEQINMKRLLFLIFNIVLCFCSCYAQKDDALTKQAKKTIKNQAPIEAELMGKKNTLDSLISLVKERKIQTYNSEGDFKRYLCTFKSVSDMASNSTLYKNLKDKSRFGLYELAKTYIRIIDMYKSLHSGYKQNENAFFLEYIDADSKNILSDHSPEFKESFRKVESAIKDYNLVMYELARVFEIVDSENKSYETLENEGETEYIAEVPYAEKKLKQYIKAGNNVDARKKIRKELHNSLPDAFPE